MLFRSDGVPGVLDPRGLIGGKLSVDMHVVASEAAAARNVMLSVERCHLEVDAVVSTPYASGLSVLVDDVEEAYARAVRLGHEIVHPLTVEEWGVHRFLVRAPDGNVLNIVGHPDERV